MHPIQFKNALESLNMNLTEEQKQIIKYIDETFFSAIEENDRWELMLEEYNDFLEQVISRVAAGTSNGFYLLSSRGNFRYDGYYIETLTHARTVNRNVNSSSSDFITLGLAQNSGVYLSDASRFVNIYVDSIEQVKKSLHLLRVEFVAKCHEHGITRMTRDEFELITENIEDPYRLTWTTHMQLKKILSSTMYDMLYTYLERTGDYGYSQLEKLSRHVIESKAHNFRLSDDAGNMLCDNYNAHTGTIKTTTMKIGKAIKKIMEMTSLTYDDNTIKSLTTMASMSVSDLTMVVVSGEDIRHHYNYENHSSLFALGSLGSSCMRYEECQDYLDVYVDHAKMLVCLDPEGNTVGRAILWDNVTVSGWRNFDTSEESEKYRDLQTIKLVDRIYSDEKVHSLFFKWAKENGYFRKRYQAYTSETEFVSPTGGECMAYLEIDVTLDKYYSVPYIDTFAWSDDEKSTNIQGFGWYTARDTGGSLDGRNYNDYNEDKDY